MDKTEIKNRVFIEKARQIHNTKYDYSKVEYINSHTKVCIICPIHGEFWQTPNSHLNGNGCPKCGKEKSAKTRIKEAREEFVDKAKKIHGDKYDYSKVEYVDSTTKVCIICPIHGEFWQRPYDHIANHGCRECGIEESRNKQRLSNDFFLERVNHIYNGVYDFSCSDYVNNDVKVKCFCKKHGEFWQTPHHLFSGIACEKCGRERMCNAKIEKSSSNFETRSRKIHGDKYDYSKVKYEHNQKEVCIICPEHGEFWQKPMLHLSGCGCPKCNSSKLENDVRNFLNENKIEFREQKTFNWLKSKNHQYLDFYLPKYNIAIECQGKQHFKPVDFANKGLEWAYQELKKNIERDKIKNRLCKQNGIKILFYSNEEYPGMITDLNELKKAIKLS